MKRMQLAILLATGLAGLQVTSAQAGSFWSVTSNNTGSAKSGCHVQTANWFAASCKSSTVSDASGAGKGQIGLVFFGTKRDEQKADSLGFAGTQGSTAAADCNTFTLNSADANCLVESDVFATDEQAYEFGRAQKVTRTITLKAW